jgi:hypothetical protein
MSAMNCYIDRVLNRFADDITYRIFLMIEKDKKLLREYWDIVNSGTDQHGLNGSLGKQIKVKFNLENKGICKNRQTTLIKSYTRHRIK